jgi:hypothetical protein
MERKEETYNAVKTFLPFVSGAFAGLLSWIAANPSRDPVGIVILVLFIYMHKFVFLRLGMEVKGKDWILIAFLTFTMWYIVWTFLLNLR